MEKIKWLMELCLQSDETFDDCRFMVYGGIRVTERKQPEVRE